MSSVVEKSISGNERVVPVMPDEQANERSAAAVLQPRYSYAHEYSGYSYRMRSAPSFDLKAEYAPRGYWLVWNRPTGIFGEGDNLWEAVEDFERAAAGHLDVLEEERDTLPDGQLWQLDYLRARVRR
jgi:hypothetical protein